MERSHTPLNVWFWAAYLVASQTPGMSAVQFQRQLGLSRYETAFQILHKLRSGMVRPNQDRIGGQPKNHVEVDETWVGGRTRGEGRGVHHKVPVSCAIEVRHRKPGTKLDNRKDGRYAGRVRLAVVLDRIKDMVVRGGENVYPREIEEFLYGHPAIEDVQVIGVPDDKYGEELCAWVKLRDGEDLDADGLRAHCQGQIAHFKIPRYVKFVDEFPVTVTGKVQKFLMREQMLKELDLTERDTA